MTVASPAIRELDLEAEGLRWVQPNAIMAHPFEDGSAITLHRELEPTVASLEEASPGAGAAWGRLIEQYRPLGQRLVEAILSPLPPVGPSIAVAVALRRDALLLARRMAGSIEAFGLDVFDGASRPTAWLAGSAQHSGLAPSTAGSGAFGFLRLSSPFGGDRAAASGEALLLRLFERHNSLSEVAHLLRRAAAAGARSSGAARHASSGSLGWRSAPETRKPASLQGIRPLDPGFGSAIWQ
jgi:hypothetical protein